MDTGTVALSQAERWESDCSREAEFDVGVWVCVAAPRVTQLEGNSCEILWETVPPMKGDPVNYILQVLVGRESEYKQVRPGVRACAILLRQAGCLP